MTELARREVVRVRIEDATGAMQDMGDLAGVDFVDSVEVSADQNAFARSATIHLRREATAGTTTISLAPLITDHVAAGRLVEVHYSVTAPQVPASWELLFEGQIDDAGWGGDQAVLSVPCRDRAGILHDVWLESIASYGDDDSPVPIQTVMAQLLTAGLAGKAPALTTVGDPDFGILRDDFGHASLETVLLRLRDLIGWDLRYRLDAGEYKLTLSEPDSTKTVPDHTFGTDDYFRLSAVELRTGEIRNVVIVLYTTADGVDDYVQAVDETSIALLASDHDTGRRLLVLDERQVPLLSTEAAVEYLANAALRDCSQPPLTHVAEQAFSPAIQLGDLVRYEADGIHYDTDQDVAVCGYTHRLSATEASTTVEAQGKPTGGNVRWLRRRQQYEAQAVIELVRIEATDRDGATPAKAYIVGRIADPFGRTGRLEVWANKASTAPAMPLGLADGTVMVSAGQTFGAAGGLPGPTDPDVVTAMLSDVAMPESHPKLIYWRWTALDGRSTGIRDVMLTKRNAYVRDEGEPILPPEALIEVASMTTTHATVSYSGTGDSDDYRTEAVQYRRRVDTVTSDGAPVPGAWSDWGAWDGGKPDTEEVELDQYAELVVLLRVRDADGRESDIATLSLPSQEISPPRIPELPPIVEVQDPDPLLPPRGIFSGIRRALDALNDDEAPRLTTGTTNRTVAQIESGADAGTAADADLVALETGGYVDRTLAQVQALAPDARALGDLFIGGTGHLRYGTAASPSFRQHILHIPATQFVFSDADLVYTDWGIRGTPPAGGERFAYCGVRLPRSGGSIEGLRITGSADADTTLLVRLDWFDGTVVDEIAGVNLSTMPYVDEIGVNFDPSIQEIGSTSNLVLRARFYREPEGEDPNVDFYAAQIECFFEVLTGI